MSVHLLQRIFVILLPKMISFAMNRPSIHTRLFTPSRSQIFCNYIGFQWKGVRI